ncbi:MAG: Bor family protein [Rhodoferax sp.]|nr:Bor family protein [Rhodoferax sp.]MDP3651862.1 Bor family protein [Rhodoferax sp.]
MFKSLVSTLLISVALVGCANQRFNVAGEGSSTAPKLEDRQSFFISGLGQKQTIDAAKICGGAGKVDTVDVEHTFVDGLLGFFSLGIYTPRTARVYCKA